MREAPGLVEDLFRENERTAPASEGRRMATVGGLSCELGGELPAVDIAFETFGTLSEARDNAILVCHALSGDSHCIGWWDRLIGPGKAIDTDQYFVIGTNCLGGCQGSTGPASLAPDGKPYGSRFPQITIGDMVEVQARLVEQLGIGQLLAVAGGSMGGMQALEWAVRFPGRVRKAFVTASCAAHNAMQIGFNEAARQAVMRDHRWKGGEYDPGVPPLDGLAVARMIGHLSFLSEAAFDAKFGRKLQRPGQFQVESYLNYQGDKFTARFDANSLLVLTRAIDLYQLDSLGPALAEFLFVSFTSDWLYPSHQSAGLHEMAGTAGRPSRWENIDLPFGHDAFLLDGEVQGEHLRSFLSERR